MLSEEFVFLTKLLNGSLPAKTHCNRLLDTDRLAGLVLEHQVLPETHAALCSLQNNPLAKHQEDLKQGAEESVQHQMLIVQLLSAVNTALKARAISFILLKGAAVAYRWYPNPLQREFNDIDLLIRAVDVPAAHSALKRAGFLPVEDLSLIELAHEIRFQHSRCYRHQLTGIEVDLHWRLVQRAYGISFDIEELFSRAQRVFVSDTSFLTLHEIDEFIFLCCHAAKHHWEKLRWIRDLSLISAKLSEPDWKELGKRARALRAEVMVQDGQRLSQKLFSTTCGMHHRSSAYLAQKQHGQEDFYLNTYLDFMDGKSPPSVRDRYLLDLHCQSGIIRKMRYLFCRLLFPHGADRSWLKLPERLGALYWIVRPLRLLSKAIRS